MVATAGRISWKMLTFKDKLLGDFVGIVIQREVLRHKIPGKEPKKNGLGVPGLISTTKTVWKNQCIVRKLAHWSRRTKVHSRTPEYLCESIFFCDKMENRNHAKIVADSRTGDYSHVEPLNQRVLSSTSPQKLKYHSN